MSHLYTKKAHVCNQLTESFDHLLSDVLRILKRGLGDRKTWATFLMDLSKAFDCLSHEPSLAKIEANGLSGDVFLFIQLYLQERHQRVKITSKSSD